MTASRPFRLAVVNSHPIQYFAPLYAYLNRDPELEVTALYCSDFSLRGGVDPGFKQVVTWDVDLLEGDRHVFLGERAKRRSIGGFWSLVRPEVWGEIRSGRYDAVWLHGYGYAAYVLASLAAKKRRLAGVYASRNLPGAAACSLAVPVVCRIRCKSASRTSAHSNFRAKRHTDCAPALKARPSRGLGATAT